MRQPQLVPNRINHAVIAFRWCVWIMPSFIAATSALLIDKFKVPLPLEVFLAFYLVVLLGIGGFDTMLARKHRNQAREIVFGIFKFVCMQLFLMPLLLLSVWIILDRGGLFR